MKADASILQFYGTRAVCGEKGLAGPVMGRKGLEGLGCAMEMLFSICISATWWFPYLCLGIGKLCPSLYRLGPQILCLTFKILKKSKEYFMSYKHTHNSDFSGGMEIIAVRWACSFVCSLCLLWAQQWKGCVFARENVWPIAPEAFTSDPWPKSLATP